MYQQESFGQAFKRGWNMMPAGLRWILAVNIGVFFVTAVGGSDFSRFMTETFGFYSDPLTTVTQPWRLITYMFLHGGVFHLLFNMLWVWFLGRMVEDHLGTRNFLVIYFGAGIGGALINTIVTTIFGGSGLPTIGASGAVFGVMVAFAMLFPTFKLMLLLLPPIEARFLVAGLIAIDLLFISSSDNIARIVHLGGAFWGWALVTLYYRGYNYDAWIRAVQQKFSRPSKETAGGPRRKPGQRRTAHMQAISDAEILDEVEQNELDRILEKISKSGYDGLSDKEKRKLFELSKRDD
jgi:membrane associated rhomboid family serine protease